MAHNQLYGVCYSDCQDSSHPNRNNPHLESGDWLHNGYLVYGYISVDENGRRMEMFNSPPVCTIEDFKKLKGNIKESEEYVSFSLDAEKTKNEKLSSSFSSVKGAKIPYPKDKYDEVKVTTIVPDDLLMASQFSHIINKFNSDVNIEKIKYDSSLNLAKTKEMINQTEAFNKLQQSTETLARIEAKKLEIDSNNLRIQEKIAKKETNFKNNTTVNNNFDKDFAENLGKSIGDSLKTVLESNNQLMKNIEKSLKVQEDYFKNLTEKNIVYNGKSYSKMEIDNKVSTEKLAGLEAENSFNIDEVSDFLDDALSDGFDLNYNPFEKMLNLIKSEYEQEEKEIKIKYKF